MAPPSVITDNLDTPAMVERPLTDTDLLRPLSGAIVRSGPVPE